MSSGSSNVENWETFFDEKGIILSPDKKTPFLKNFSIMDDILKEYFGTPRWSLGKTCLEIGAGRGTMSDLFNIRGCMTYCTDMFEHMVGSDSRSRVHQYRQHDILRDKPIEETFDIILTYGLLEHFVTEDKLTILRNIQHMKSKWGIEIHYVVPKKWTNWNESSVVYRDRCKDLLNVGLEHCQKNQGLVHVFPYFKSMSWVCSPRFSKGFIMWSGAGV